MTEVEDTTDRKAKRLRRIAKVLTLAWAGCCTLWILGWVFAPWISWPERYSQLGFLDWLTIAAWALAPWVAAAIAWRWRYAGVVLLPLASLLLPGGVFNTPPQAAGTGNSYALGFLMILLGCLLAPMFLLSVLASSFLVLCQRWSLRAERREHYEAAKRYHLTRESLTVADLSHCDLTGIDLSEAQLERANLREANLCHANLAGSDLSDANLFLTNLEDACLESAKLRRAYLSGASLAGANLAGAILEEANLFEADLEGANLRGALLAGAMLNDGTIMPEGWEEVVASVPEDEPPQTAQMKEGDT